MPSAPPGVAFTIAQLASFLAWSEDERHDFVAVVRWDYEAFDEVIEIWRDGESQHRPRWLIHKVQDGTIYVTRSGAKAWKMDAASAEEAQALIEAAEYRAQGR